MNDYTPKLTRALSHLGVRIFERDYSDKGFHAKIIVEDSNQIPELAQVLYNLEYFMGFVTAAHTTPAIQMLYQFARFDVNHRIMIQCAVDENNSVPTISHIFHGADWHERETRDFFGVAFIDHPNPAPLILDESDKDLKPLLKSEKKLKSVEEIFMQEGPNG